MRRLCMALVLPVALGLMTGSTVTVDLRGIGHLPSKGRAQDQANPPNRVVSAIIAAGPDAIPFLVDQLSDETVLEGPVLDFWPQVRVGDVALVLLCDLFKAPDGISTTVPGLAWDTLLERDDVDIPAWSLLNRYVAAHGRRGLQSKVEQLLKPYVGRFAWDKSARCFLPVEKPPPNPPLNPTGGKGAPAG